MLAYHCHVISTASFARFHEGLFVTPSTRFLYFLRSASGGDMSLFMAIVTLRIFESALVRAVIAPPTTIAWGMGS